jgi:methionyl-tRNA formyltransferase
MILKDEVEITNNMTTEELHDILMIRGADLLVKSIEAIVDGNIVLQKQSDETFYAKMLDKDLANIDWNKSSEEIHNLVRGLNSWPIAYTSYKGERMKIYETEALEDKTSRPPGTILDVSKNGVKVSCKDSVLIIKKVQFPNGKPLTIEQYINGHEIEKNIVLG